ncbi:Pyruvate dehydrogenase complex dihydrolipoamide acetyltransferase [Candidatus Glomeribacter gigasporarum BEG34]|uniref:Acetyltransferase component of pyruvate dehydrogenase complex n=1 Tax=Candidatus Glomeribacter gigasporarum BEG34 TaxID=1070319 RepID=G2J8A3_9BURK|nr:dihydrolipoyllysine-residue acetyltransferase [Candidatus Glomeribacter gigasporarum]CCD29000.1 Pyruvate dehydrogenase complex dihydrolipoamide acetyltransferase [Candidatus Glomeribacter gigasporarum BEG34]
MSQFLEVKVPDIGDYKDVPVIEVYVQSGESVEAEQSLMTLESDKATIDVPSPAAGIVKEIRLKAGDTVSEGALILLLEPAVNGAQTFDSAPEASAPTEASATESPASISAAVPPALAAEQKRVAPPPPLAAAPAIAPDTGAACHASPSVRQFAHTLGVDIGRVQGSGPKGRITHDDVTAYVKDVLQKGGGAASGATSPGGFDLPAWPNIEFAKFGAVESRPLSRIQKISGANLHRNWVMIPHVTHHEEADISALEEFRVQLNREQQKAGIKVTLLAFLIKASVAALKQYPYFNASLAGDQLILKQYYNIGFAADTPHGLVVPVIRAVDRKGVLEIAQETAELAKQARDGKLSAEHMQGGCFSISSLGGIGGTAFTPIINAPEVAILGVSRSRMQPVWDGAQCVPRLLLPLSLSYDHRVIDGAAAARFSATLARLLTDFRRALL